MGKKLYVFLGSGNPAPPANRSEVEEAEEPPTNQLEFKEGEEVPRLHKAVSQAFYGDGYSNGGYPNGNGHKDVTEIVRRLGYQPWTVTNGALARLGRA